MSCSSVRQSSDLSSVKESGHLGLGVFYCLIQFLMLFVIQLYVLSMLQHFSMSHLCHLHCFFVSRVTWRPFSWPILDIHWSSKFYLYNIYFKRYELSIFLVCVVSQHDCRIYYNCNIHQNNKKLVHSSVEISCFLFMVKQAKDDLNLKCFNFKFCLKKNKSYWDSLGQMSLNNLTETLPRRLPELLSEISQRLSALLHPLWPVSGKVDGLHSLKSRPP